MPLAASERKPSLTDAESSYTDEKKRKMVEDITNKADADDESSSSDDESDEKDKKAADEDNEEDEEAELMRELEKIKKERAEEAERKAREEVRNKPPLLPSQRSSKGVRHFLMRETQNGYSRCTPI